jgi:hypothetical protein
MPHADVADSDNNMLQQVIARFSTLSNNSAPELLMYPAPLPPSHQVNLAGCHHSQAIFVSVRTNKRQHHHLHADPSAIVSAARVPGTQLLGPCWEIRFKAL